MKKNFERVIAAFLLLVMLVSSVACADKDGISEESGEGTGAVSQEATSKADETEDPNEWDDLPEKMDFGKEAIDVLVRGNKERYWSDFYSESETGDVVGDEVFRRELRVEDRLNVEINVVLETTVTSNAAHGPWSVMGTSIDSGECVYEFAVGSNFNAQSESVKGRFHNLLNVNAINLDKNYWAKYINENTKVGRAMYTVTGDISTFLYDSLYVMFFNRRLCEDFQIQARDIYKDVNDKKWTIDRLITLTKDIYVDNDGSGTKTDGDTFGLGLIVTSATDSLWSACNLTLIDEHDGVLECAIDVDKVQVVVEKFRDTLWQSNGWQALSENTNYASDTSPLFDKQFADGQLCFLTNRLFTVKEESITSMKDDYGIIPFPKYDEEQENYGSYVHDQYAVVAIPFSVGKDRIEMVGSVIEAMASDGRKYIKPVYYDVALTSRYSRDVESVQMLDIIFNNIRMDKGFVYGNPLSNFHTGMMRNQIWKNTDTVASSYKTFEKTSKTTLQKLSENLASYADR